jgi:hypothetical protein
LGAAAEKTVDALEVKLVENQKKKRPCEVHSQGQNAVNG